MSETKQVGTVLLAVPLYEVDGEARCHNCVVQSEDAQGSPCWRYKVGADGHYLRHDTGQLLRYPGPVCPLRAPEALTVAEVVAATNGRPIQGTYVPQGGKCPWCGVASGLNVLPHKSDCPSRTVLAEHDATVAKLRRLAGEVG